MRRLIEGTQVSWKGVDFGVVSQVSKWFGDEDRYGNTIYSTCCRIYMGIMHIYGDWQDHQKRTFNISVSFEPI